jgi:hypothetical protein
MEKISGIWYNVRAYMDIFFSILTSDKVCRRFIASAAGESGGNGRGAFYGKF